MNTWERIWTAPIRWALRMMVWNADQERDHARDMARPPDDDYEQIGERARALLDDHEE